MTTVSISMLVLVQMCLHAWRCVSTVPEIERAQLELAIQSHWLAVYRLGASTMLP